MTESWTSTNVFVYAKFRSVADAEATKTRMTEFVDSNVTFNIPGLENIPPSDILTLGLRPAPDIHLYAAALGGMKSGGDIVAVYTFSAVAVLILLIASINFMNLSTARSIQRAREISMRKVVGARRSQLVVQFLGESVLMTLLALALALTGRNTRWSRSTLSLPRTLLSIFGTIRG
ncbi:MAG: ABC transporter permease [Sphingomonadales bacterium]